MTCQRLAALVCTAVAITGCSKADASAGRITELCGSLTNMSPDICRCLGEKAGTDLTPDAREFLVATLEKKEARVNELRGKLSLQEAMQAGMFMVNGPRACAGTAADLPTEEASP